MSHIHSFTNCNYYNTAETRTYNNLFQLDGIMAGSEEYDWRDRLRIAEARDPALVRDMGPASDHMTKHCITGIRTGIVERLQKYVFFSQKSGVSREEQNVNG